ncbi:hypothetical protein L7F22_056153 [Adiantum nelumboides]|nr:hypothetical protein [Adiantum nelumboides]
MLQSFTRFGGSHRVVVEYSYSSITFATKSFSNVIGEGGFGKVYKGALPQNGCTHKVEGRHNMQIAVKVLEMRSKRYGMVLLQLISGRQNFAYDASMGSCLRFIPVPMNDAMFVKMGYFQHYFSSVN